MAQPEQPRAAWADQLDTLDDVLPVPVGLPLSVVGQDAAPTQANTDPDTALAGAVRASTAAYFRPCQQGQDQGR